MPFWDALKTEQGYPWNPAQGPGQRNDYSIPLPVGTPIEAPVSGIVLPEHTSGGGYYSYYGRKVWGGSVDILTFMPEYGGLVNVNGLHFDTINVQPGDVVVKGRTILGTSGGQTSGGSMPSSPQFSSGPHIGWGVHAVDDWNRMYNPQTLIDNLLAGRDSSSVPGMNQLQSAGLGSLPNGGTPVQQPVGTTQALTGNGGDPCAQWAGIDPRGWLCRLQQQFSGLFRWLADPLRFIKLGGGVLLVGLGVVLFALPAAMDSAGRRAQIAGAATGQPEIAALGGAMRRGKSPSQRATAGARAYRGLSRPRKPASASAPTPAPKQPAQGGATSDGEPVYSGGKRVGTYRAGRIVFHRDAADGAAGKGAAVTHAAS